MTAVAIIDIQSPSLLKVSQSRCCSCICNRRGIQRAGSITLAATREKNENYCTQPKQKTKILLFHNQVFLRVTFFNYRITESLKHYCDLFSAIM